MFFYFTAKTIFRALTVPVRVRVFVVGVLSGAAEAVKTEVCDLQDEATVDDAVGRLQ